MSPPAVGWRTKTSWHISRFGRKPPRRTIYLRECGKSREPATGHYSSRSERSSIPGCSPRFWPSTRRYRHGVLRDSSIRSQPMPQCSATTIRRSQARNGSRKVSANPAALTDLHAGREYLVYCVGFAPGFTYCGELPEILAVPRLATPRQIVPAGSIAIAGRQTGIYAVDSPGGWNLIGRTSWRLFDPVADAPARFKAGDRLRFVPTS